MLKRKIFGRFAQLGATLKRMSYRLSRRRLFEAGAGVWATGLSQIQVAQAKDAANATSWVARAPSGFVPFAAPGLVAKASAKGSYSDIMQPNQLWPKERIARALLERALTDLTGASNVIESMKRFIHPADVVAVKVNGIAGQTGHTVAVNFELILPVVEAVMAVGVPAEKITVYEQFPNFLQGSRVNVRRWQLPKGVVSGTHNNRDCKMPPTRVFERVPTRYCRFFTDATAVINMTMMKDHSICGFTGALKNITHGNIDNPHKHHAHQASPQIALLYNHPIVQSRVRLHLTDAFKIIYDRGPLDKDPKTRAAHGSVYASTDPVALDTVGLGVIEKERRERGVPTLAAVGRPARYIHRAAELGIGVHEWDEIRLRSATI